MNICAVIVTFNRKELLQKVLQSFEQLKSPPNSIVIIDNNSTDGTIDVIQEWSSITRYDNVHYIHLDENIGGSGGFYEGLNYALKLEPDWIWVSDDDAIPDENCFEIIRKKIATLNQDEVSAVCCSVINNGQIDLLHRRRLVKNKFFLEEKIVDLNEYLLESFQFDLFSYVGTVINTNKLKKSGLPERDYFIWYDDTEHSWRLSLQGKIICVPAAKIYHDIAYTDSTSWKTYYGMRNQLLTFKKHHYITYLKSILYWKKKILLSRSLRKKISYRDILIEAVNDAIGNRKGLHSLYRPGWNNANHKK